MSPADQQLKQWTTWLLRSQTDESSYDFGVKDRLAKVIWKIVPNPKEGSSFGNSSLQWTDCERS